MTNRALETSPRTYARIGGALYLIIIVIGLFGQALVRDRLIVAGDATATAANIAASQSLWRLSVAGELAYLACAVVLCLILYALLRPVSRNLALLGVFFNLVAIAVEVVARLNLLAALVLLGDAAYLNAFEPNQLHALAYVSVRMHDYGFAISLLFFGCVCLVFGHLIRKSGYFPGMLGVLMQIAGVCYLTNSFAFLLSPTLAGMLFPAILVPAFVAELSLTLWLLVKGVDVAKWEDRAQESRRGVPVHPLTS